MAYHCRDESYRFFDIVPYPKITSNKYLNIASSTKMSKIKKPVKAITAPVRPQVADRVGQ